MNEEKETFINNNENKEHSENSNCGSQLPNEPALVREPTPLANSMANHQQYQQPIHATHLQAQTPATFLHPFPQQQQQHQHGFAVTSSSPPLVTPPAPPMQSPLSPSTDEDKKKKRGTPHMYHDYSAVQDTLGFVRKKTGGVTQAFPEKLMEMLTAEADNQTLVGWLPHGRAFIVRKPKLFTEEIMPKYFRQSKLTSFQRQLNLYGFRRLTQGADAGAYYHELFLRGRPQLCQRMNRQKVKGTGHKQPADAQSEPNFYMMPNTPEPGYESQSTSGIQGLQGAADLLKGFASSVPVSNLSGATWPAPLHLSTSAPGVAQCVYNQAPTGAPQPQLVYTQGPNGQPQMQQIMYAPAAGQASVTLGSDGQYYLTTTPSYAAPVPTGESQQQQYAPAPANTMLTYNDGSYVAPTLQFLWPQQLQQQQGQQAWIQQAQQIQQISQPSQDQATQQAQQLQQQQSQVQQYHQQQQRFVQQGEQVAYSQQPAAAPTLV